jgi:hypothetical protein
MQKTSLGAIGVTNPSYMTAGLATRPAGFGLTDFICNHNELNLYNIAGVNVFL